ncbi:MAG: hypothetical protein KAW17_00055 [Candidatus Eisenbacteria sp.]|nr:hypothetical protein [Candidatus Eisenbacteria bacterium]
MKLEGLSGPFPFCDYWATVLRLRGVASERLVSGGHVSFDLFRKGLDRPRTRMPKLRYYILAFMLGPGMIPYKLVFTLALLFKPKSEKKSLFPKVDRKLADYTLQLDADPTDSRWVGVSSKGRTVAPKILNPAHVSVATGLFFPMYKVLVAALLAILVIMVAIPQLPEIHPVFVRYPALSLLLYPLLLLGLYGVFRDIWTACLAPLPALGARWLFSVSGGIPEFFLAMAGVALLFYLVEWFFIPRSTLPSLFLYVNDPSSEIYPYGEGHEPYWLKGSHYWVWRFVVLAPAEIMKFWEKDWERVEVWVRADPGEKAGQIEWIVTDCHYRELWFRYDCETTKRGRQRNAALLHESMIPDGPPFSWVVEYDMDFLWHTPDVRGVFAARRSNGKVPGGLMRIIKALGRRPRRDRFRDYREQIEDLEADGGELFEEAPEHFRQLMLRKLVRLPWTYWRYPKGAVTSLKVPVYDPAAVLSLGYARASDERCQIKVSKTKGEQD